MRYAFINSEGIVVNVIVGILNDDEVDLFLRDYQILFGAERVIPVGDDSVSVFSGGIYNELEGFLPPPPVPQPEIVEGTSEEIIEEIVEGTTNDAA
jgi:hypothetical protein